MITLTSMTNSNTYIKTGNFLLDDYIEKGIPQGKLTMIVGKSRQTGKSMYLSKMMSVVPEAAWYASVRSTWRKTNRQMKLKRIFDIIDNNS